jgi:hypothetical protein
VDGQPVEFVFPASYKALALCAAETVLAAGTTLRWPDWRCRTATVPALWQRESLYFLRSEGEALVRTQSGECRITGDGAVWAGEPGEHAVVATQGRCYVAAFFAGPDKALAMVPVD